MSHRLLQIHARRPSSLTLIQPRRTMVCALPAPVPGSAYEPALGDEDGDRSELDAYGDVVDPYTPPGAGPPPPPARLGGAPASERCTGIGGAGRDGVSDGATLPCPGPGSPLHSP